MFKFTTTAGAVSHLYQFDWDSTSLTGTVPVWTVLAGL